MVLELLVKKYVKVNNSDTSTIELHLVCVDEKWKHVYFRNIKSDYLVSNLGRIKKPDGEIANLYYDKNGYTRFSFYIAKNNSVFKNKKAIRYPYKTHRAVAEAFVKNNNPKDKTDVMHKNDINDCNIYLNLKWGTPKENMDDKKKSGRAKYLRGEDKPDSKFKEQDVRNICDCIYNKNIRLSNDIIKYLGYENKSKKFIKSYKILISNIRKKHCWKYIINEYEK